MCQLLVIWKGLRVYKIHPLMVHKGSNQQQQGWRKNLQVAHESSMRSAENHLVKRRELDEDKKDFTGVQGSHESCIMRRKIRFQILSEVKKFEDMRT